jgi:hypothetical protein
MASRQNAIYTIFFSQTYVTSILVYLGLGPAAVAVLTTKSLITTLAHSSTPTVLSVQASPSCCMGSGTDNFYTRNASCASRRDD